MLRGGFAAWSSRHWPPLLPPLPTHMALALAAAGGFHHIAGRGRLSLVRARATGANALVQRIFDLSSAGDLDGAAAALDALEPADVALEPVAPGPSVGYESVHKAGDLSIGIFLLPKGAALPLHDHPGMAVLSKLLSGRLRVTSYDRPASDARGPRLRCAPPTTRTLAAPCAPLRLGPVTGNIHAFEALDDCAIFDVLTPPYDDFAGRSCHYYEVASAAEAEHELVEVGWPPSLHVRSRPYRGPKPAVGRWAGWRPN